MAPVLCPNCGLQFVKKGNLTRHLKTSCGKTKCTKCRKSVVDLNVHTELFHGQHKCPKCGKVFAQLQNMKNHMQCHEERFICAHCTISFTRKDNLRRHIIMDHGASIGGIAAAPTRTSLQGSLLDFDIEGKQTGDVNGFFAKHDFVIVNTLSQLITIKKGIKWALHLLIKFIREFNGQTISTKAWFTSEMNIGFSTSNLEADLRLATAKLIKSIEEFERMGSGWKIDEVIKLTVKVAEYEPLYGSSYLPLPKKLADRKAIINVQNEDELCILYAISAHRHPIDNNPQRASHYTAFIAELNISGLDFPLKISCVPKLEKMNRDLAINVFAYDERKDKVYPVYITKKGKTNVINLMYISNDEKSHYCLIKNFSRLMAYTTRHEHETFYCYHCLHRFSSLERLKNHRRLCSTHKAQRVSYGEEGDVIKFKNHHYGIPTFYRIYADFECLCKHCDDDEENTNTSFLAKHEPSGFAYVVIDEDGKIVDSPVVYRGPEAAKKFLESALETATKLMKVIEDVKPIIMTPEDQAVFDATSTCKFCKEQFSEDTVKCRDHCHRTGKFRFALCSKCNLNFKKSLCVPTILHNLRGYDSHIICQALGDFPNRDLKCIGKNLDQYITFSVGPLRFLDSYQFMAASLATLVQNLENAGVSNFKIMKQQFPPEKVALLLRKGVYPYEYMDSMDKFDETQLPSKDKFYSTLTQENITDADYRHAHTVWESFNMQNLGQYHDLYVLTDVLLLSDIFESFRRLCLKIDGIDPCHVYTAPGLSWESMLKMTEVQMEVITDPDMYLFIEKGIRGGISTVSLHHAKANNQHMSDFDANEESSYIWYTDACNLYGYALRCSLPLNGFRWIDQPQLFDIHSCNDDDGTGWILEVDLDCPREVHDKLNDYPPCAEHMVVTKAMCSEYTIQLGERLNVPIDNTTPRLITHLMGVKNYAIHYTVLRQVLELGLVLKKVHRVLTFNQSPWLRPYIDFNTDMRKNAQNDFEKDYYKLKINSLYGRCLMNVRKHNNIEMVNNHRRGIKLTASPALMNFKILNDDLSVFQLKKVEVKLTTPIYVGFSVLELSKHKMYDFFYNTLKREYGDRMSLILTDTDSFIVHLKTKDMYEDLKRYQDLLDCSGYPRDHMLYSEVNKKVVGKFKDEFPNQVISKVVAVRSKMYSIKSSDGSVKKVAKGIVRPTLKNNVNFDDFERCVLNSTVKFVENVTIRSTDHNLHTIRQKKLALNPTDTKRYQIDGIKTLAFGHFSIPERIMHVDDRPGPSRSPV